MLIVHLVAVWTLIQPEVISLIFYLTLLTELPFTNESKGRTVTLPTSIACGKVWNGQWLFLESIINKGDLRLYVGVGVGVGTLEKTLYTSYLLSFTLDSESFTVAEAYNLQETKTDCFFATAFTLSRN